MQSIFLNNIDNEINYTIDSSASLIRQWKNDIIINRVESSGILPFLVHLKLGVIRGVAFGKSDLIGLG